MDTTSSSKATSTNHPNEYFRKRLVTEAFFNSALDVGEKIADKFFILRSIAYQMLEPLGFSQDFIEIAANAFCYRERISTTAIGEGVAIPHGKVPMIENVICGWFISRRGVDFASLDGAPTRIFCCLLAPENAAADHLKSLVRITRTLKDPNFRDTLLGLAETAESSNDFRSMVEREFDNYFGVT